MTKIARFGRGHPQRQYGEKRHPPDEHIEEDAGDPAHDLKCRSASRSRLLELDKRSTEILRMQKQHWLVMRTQARFAITKDPRTFGAQPIACGGDVIDLVAQVMNAARRVALEKSAHW